MTSYEVKIFPKYVVRNFGTSELQIWSCRLVQELELFGCEEQVMETN